MVAWFSWFGFNRSLLDELEDIFAYGKTWKCENLCFIFYYTKLQLIRNSNQKYFRFVKRDDFVGPAW